MSNQKDSINEEVITINLDKFIMPLSILFSALILSAGLLIGLNNIATSLRGGGGTNTGTTDTGTQPNPGTATSVTQDQLKSLFGGGNLAFGDADRKVIFVEFSDPSCPYCHIASGKNGDLNKSAGAQFTLVQDGGTYVAPVVEMKKLVDSGQASYVWVYQNGHGNGEMATKALYCAQEQGRFWEAHDLLYTAAGYSIVNDTVKNDKSKSGDMAEFLSSALNAGELKSCLDSGKYDNRISEDQALARSFGANGTPNFFVNTTNFPGAFNWNDMLSTVQTALQ